MKNLISFDIGIRNLAYCVFSQDISSNPILAWDVLDISTKVSTKKEEPELEKKSLVSYSCSYSCSCSGILLSKRSICKKKAKYRNAKGEYYCEKHAKEAQEKKEYYLPNPEFQIAFLKKQKVDFLVEFERKYGLLAPSALTLPGNKEKKEDRLERIVKGVQEKGLILLVDPTKKKEKKKTEIGLVEIGRNMAEHLLAIPEMIQEIDTVLIENQISPIANKMKTIQGMLAQIYILHGVENIEFVSSSNKLRGFCSSLSEEEKEKGKEDTKTNRIKNSKTDSSMAPNPNPNPNYKQHKKDGIAYCNQLLNTRGETEWKTFFETYPKKQDDLADAFLQGIWFLSKKKE
jgi:hypothetical protein